MDIERPAVLGRNEGTECPNRNPISLLYVRRIECQAFCPAATKEYLEVDESSMPLLDSDNACVFIML